MDNIIRGYTFRLETTPKQETELSKYAGACRLLWNIALEQRSETYKQFRKSINFHDQSKELPSVNNLLLKGKAS